LRSDSKFDRLHPRDRKGRFTNKPNLPDVDLPSNGSTRRKRKQGRSTVNQYLDVGQRRQKLPKPRPITAKARREQVAKIERDLAGEVDRVEDAYGFGRSTGNAFERALAVIERIAKLCGERATEALRSLHAKAVRQIELLRELDVREYGETPLHAYEYLHYATEHVGEIANLLPGNPITGRDDDALLVLYADRPEPKPPLRFRSQREAERTADALID